MTHPALCSEKLVLANVAHTQAIIAQFFQDVTTSAEIAARMVSEGLDDPAVIRGIGLSLENLTWSNYSTLSYAHDTSQSRVSEFYVSPAALSSDPSPSFELEIGGNCSCRAEWERFCNRTAKIRNGAACMPCARACEVSLGMRMSSFLHTYVLAMSKKTQASSWRWSRGDGTAQSDWGRVWVSYGSTDTLSLQYLRTTFSKVHKGKSGNQASKLVYPRASAGDTSATWSRPYIVSAIHPPSVTVGAPSYSREGTYLGGFFIDLRLSATRALFGNSSSESGIRMLTMLTDNEGELIGGSDEAIQSFFGECQSKVCNALDIGKIILSEMDDELYSRTETHHSVEFGGSDYEVFHAHIESLRWTILTFVLRSDLYAASTDNTAMVSLAVLVPIAILSAVAILVVIIIVKYLHRKVKDLQSQLGSVATENVLGTPAEEVVCSLLRIQQRKKLRQCDRDELLRVISLVSQNKLHKADGQLKKKLRAMNLEKGVDAFILDVLKGGDNDGSSTHRSSFHTQSQLAEASSVLGEIDLGSSRQTLPSSKDKDLVDVGSERLRELCTLTLSDGRQVNFSSWEFDVELIPLPKGRTLLEIVGGSALESNGLIDAFFLPRQKVYSFLAAVDRGYNSVPYHCNLHAADVTQAMNYLMQGVSDITFTKEEKLAAILAALNFLQASSDLIHFQHNGSSALENMHLSETMQMLFLESEFNFLEVLNKEARISLHKLICQLVLATDMSKHLEITSQFSTRLTAGTMANSRSDRVIVLQMLLKMADISNSTRCWATCNRWGQRVMEEFFGQGDRERQLGIPISPFMDRDATDTSRCQFAFIRFVVNPMVDMVSKINADVSSTLAPNVARNSATWREIGNIAASSEAESPLCSPSRSLLLSPHEPGDRSRTPEALLLNRAVSPPPRPKPPVDPQTLGRLQGLRDQAEQLRRAGKFQATIETATQALGIDPRDADSLVVRASARVAVRDLEGAVRDCDAALAEDQFHAGALATRGEAHRMLGDLRRARSDAETAIACDTQVARAEGRWREGVKHASDSLVADDTQVFARVSRAACLIALGDAKAAQVDADLVVQQKPSWPLPYLTRAEARLRSGDPLGALQDTAQVMRLAPGSKIPLALSAEANLMLGRPQEALAEATVVVQADARMLTRALAYNCTGEYDGAVVDTTAVIKVMPKCHKAFTARADARRLLGETEAAIDDTTTALSIEPNDATALSIRAECHRVLGDNRAADQYASAALRNSGGNISLGDKTTARGDLKTILKNEPRNTVAKALLETL
eukprot:m51a1_g13956 putative 3 -cyclic-nucleotide phosphodiesterase (1278) ;mRNA; f:937517-942415